MSTHPSEIERSFSRLNETAYGTPRTNADDFRRIVSAQLALIDTDTQFKDDAGYDNGSDVPSDKWAETVSAGAPFSPDFNFQDVGYWLKDVFGGYTVSGSGPYIHTFTPQSMSVSRQMPSRTYLEKVGGIDLRRFTSLCCTKFGLSGAKMGRLTTTLQYEASGLEATNPAGYASPGLSSGLEYGYSSQAFFRFFDNADGTNQVTTATAAGGATTPGDMQAIVTAAGMVGSPLTVDVALAGAETDAQWADKVRIALRNHLVISNFLAISGAGTSIIGTTRVRAANDPTLNIELAANGTGITDAPASADTTAGVVGDYQSYTCDLENWTLNADLPPVEPGYRQCSPYVTAGNPRSGQTRSEFNVGVRKFGFPFGVRLQAGDKLLDWMRNGTVLTLEVPIVGIDSGNSSLRFTHTRAILDQVKRTPNLNGYVGVNGNVDLMSNSGSFPLTAVLVNDIVSYAS